MKNIIKQLSVVALVAVIGSHFQEDGLFDGS